MSGTAEHGDYKNGNLLGTESAVFELAKELSKRGHDIYIIRRWKRNSLKDELIENVHLVNIVIPDIFNCHSSSSLLLLILSIYIKNEIKRINPDICVLSELISSFFVCTLNIPKIYVTHNSPGNLYSDRSFLEGKIKSLLELFVFKNCNILIALNITIYKYLIEAGYKCYFIPNGVNLERYYPNNYDMKFIFYGGRFYRVKGVDYLVKAYSMLSDEIRKEYKLVLVGDGPEKKTLETLIQELSISDRVDFIPWLRSSDFIKQMSNCSIFVLSSLSECMPVTLIEAMALGKPVIASDVPGSNDIITHGYDGFLFEKGNAHQLSDYLMLLLSDECLKTNMGINARKTIEKAYTFEKIADQYCEMFYLLIPTRNQNTSI
jgi:glycosyltransferase involved in cell wall biosynthesis